MWFLVLLLLIISNSIKIANSFHTCTHNMLLMSSKFSGLSNQARFFVRISKAASTRLFSTSSEDDTVVTRCTNKINALLNPVKLLVTSSNDDPNGSHVSLTNSSKTFCYS